MTDHYPRLASILIIAGLTVFLWWLLILGVNALWQALP